ncbi:peptidoglycan-binding domain-containing protein [Komagataeibacter europaeus]|uniref:peptidoglycan-binding domain-containing protein n=1 Tax=Komagataeibacter europaeus TaxID=33995 RepID=UPI002873216E|nr:peptidoglycan-binding domain-containing protein [Komagataeibacter europaeus]
MLFSTLLFLSGTAYGQQYRPDFNCAVDHSTDSIATMLCENSETARHELMFDQTYYALRQFVGKAGWRSLRDEAMTDEGILKQCIIATDPQQPPPADPDCYISNIDAITARYRLRLSGAALEEADRPIDEHLALQGKLIALGYLPPSTNVDGVYGEATRNAIETWQRVTGRPVVNGFLSDADAQVLLQGAPVSKQSGQEQETASPAGAQPAAGPENVAQAGPAAVTPAPMTPAPPPVAPNEDPARNNAVAGSGPAVQSDTKDAPTPGHPQDTDNRIVLRIDDTAAADIIKNATIRDIVNSPQTSMAQDFMAQDDSFSEKMETKLIRKGQSLYALHNMGKNGFDLDTPLVASISANKDVRSITLLDLGQRGTQGSCQVGRPEPTDLVMLQVKWVSPNNKMNVVTQVLFGVRTRSILHPLTSGIRCVKEATQYMYFGSLQKIPDESALIPTSIKTLSTVSPDSYIARIRALMETDHKVGMVMHSNDMQDDILWQTTQTLEDAAFPLPPSTSGSPQ